jgi:hypothetical protein
MTSKTPSKTSRMVDVQGPNWTVIPGDGIEVVASPVSWDNPSCTCGQIFVLAASPAGPDKYIWRYDFSDDTWTNMPGEASQLAVGPDGTLYAINSSGAIYEWGGSSWTALAGGANAITVASDGSLYALSNSGGGGDEPIWHYSGGTWTYVPGAGVSLAASWDTQTYSVPGGTVAPGGFYVVNSQGYLYYGSSSGSYVGLPGQVSAVAPLAIQNGASSGGGIYALGYPADDTNGNTIYYYDLDTPGWSAQAGSGTSIAADTVKSGATWSSNLYVIGASGAIYTSPVTPVAATPTPTSSPLTNSCLQSPSPSAPAGLSSKASTFFNTILPNSHYVCISMWDFSSDVYNALTSAVHNGSNVSVVIPYSERNSGSNTTDTNNLATAGAHIVWEYTSSAPASPWPTNVTYAHSSMDIHAKFALVDGLAYMDGHNWFTTDVVMEDGQSGDFADIETDLTTFPSSPPTNGTFTTDKQLSLENEASYINTENPQSGTEYDFITESFNPSSSNPNEYNDDVYRAMCHAATAGATVHVVVEEYSGYSTTAKAALQDLLLLDSHASVHTDDNGHEKISMVRGASTVWFGSSNSTTTDLIDWGMTLTDSGMVSALQTYFDGEYNGSSSIPTPAPGATASPCP